MVVLSKGVTKEFILIDSPSPFPSPLDGEGRLVSIHFLEEPSKALF
jgi:hypothetical protein